MEKMISIFDRFRERKFLLISMNILSLLLFSTGCKNSGDSSLGSYDPIGCTPSTPSAAAKKAINEKLYKSYLDSQAALAVARKLSVAVNYHCLIDQENLLESYFDLQSALGLSSDQLNLHSLRSQWGSYSIDFDSLGYELNVEDVKAHPCVENVGLQVKMGLAGAFDDPMFSSQLHLNTIGAPGAWARLSSSIEAMPDEDVVVVAVIDSGFDITHEDLVDHWWVNTGETAGNGLDDDNNGYVDDVYGYDFADNVGDPSPKDPSNLRHYIHGTAVAGMVGAKGGNGLGGSGVMPTKVKIMALNVGGSRTEEQGLDIDGIVSAIQYSIDSGADIINLSLGGAYEHPNTTTVINSAVAAGILVVAAAGNAGDTHVNFPAGNAVNLDGLVSVGATFSYEVRLTSYSSRGNGWVEYSAPGSDHFESLVATHREGTGILTPHPSNTYARMDGTSSATPVVSGAAAMILGYYKSKGISVTPATLEQKLFEASTPYKRLSNYVQSCRHLDLSKFNP